MVNFERLTDEELAMLYIGGNDSAFDELLSRTQEKVRLGPSRGKSASTTIIGG